jgi:hypothetical protein
MRIWVQKDKENLSEMAMIGVLGGLIGGAVILATLRSRRNAKKTSHVQQVKLG